jgi:hypothetical protein
MVEVFQQAEAVDLGKIRIGLGLRDGGGHLDGDLL